MGDHIHEQLTTTLVRPTGLTVDFRDLRRTGGGGRETDTTHEEEKSITNILCSYDVMSRQLSRLFWDEREVWNVRHETNERKPCQRVSGLEEMF